MSQIGDFSLTLKYTPGKSKPVPIFSSMGSSVSSMHSIKSICLDYLTLQTSVEIVLLNIENGSMRVRLRQIIKFTEKYGLLIPEIIPNIEKFVALGSRTITEFMLSDSNTKDRITGIEEELSKKAKDAEVDPYFTSINKKKILLLYDNINTSLYQLSKNETIEYSDSYGDSLQLCYQKNNEYDEMLVHLGQTEKSQEYSAILVIKKPDFLGNSKWDFKQNNRSFNARIKDEEWLTKFRQREFSVAPGDALRAIVQSKMVFDAGNTVIDQVHSILKVIEILPGYGHNQIYGAG